MHGVNVLTGRCVVADIVILACGNLSRGDDAIGPLLLERLQNWVDENGLSDRFELIYEYQFQIEHALALQERQLALFIDASVSTKMPYEFYAIEHASKDFAHTSHALSPEAVLNVWGQIESAPPPPSFVLSIRGEQFELGEGMSQSAQRNMDEAFEFLMTLCTQVNLDAWNAMA